MSSQKVAAQAKRGRGTNQMVQTQMARTGLSRISRGVRSGRPKRLLRCPGCDCRWRLAGECWCHWPLCAASEPACWMPCSKVADLDQAGVSTFALTPQRLYILPCRRLQGALPCASCGLAGAGRWPEHRARSGDLRPYRLWQDAGVCTANPARAARVLLL